jgi:IS30 family transposase
MHFKYKLFSAIKYYEIKVLMDSKFLFFEIANKLKRDPSSIIRDFNRNVYKGGRGYGIYNPERAQLKTNLGHVT